MPQLTRRAAMLLPVAVPAIAYAMPEEQVRIGATYPLSGSVASAGDEMRQAIRVAEEIINTAHPELKDLPLGPMVGLPNLGGRKVKTIFADHQGNPAMAQSETLRLITQERVVALVGAYQSSCTLTSSAVAER